MSGSFIISFVGTSNKSLLKRPFILWLFFSIYIISPATAANNTLRSVTLPVLTTLEDPYITCHFILQLPLAAASCRFPQSPPDTIPVSISDTAVNNLPSADTAFDYLEMIHYNQDTLHDVPYRRWNGNSLNHRSTIFYDSLRIKAENKKFTRGLYNALFADTTKKGQTRKVLEPDIFMTYENKIIRSITLKYLDVFGPTIEDTSIEATGFFKNIGNDLHIKTRERIIRNGLMFDEGEKLNPFLLFENERLLRELPYIDDARFLISNGSARDDSVDVVVLIKDLWPFGFGAELSDLQHGNVSLWHTNFLGLGHQLEAKLFWHTAKDNLLGNSILYRIANISGSYITGNLYYVDRWNLETYRLDLFRNFMASDINLAGAVALEKTKTTQSIALLDTTLEEVQLEYIDYDFWLGYLFSLGTKNGNQPTKTNFFIAGRLYYNDFSTSPETKNNYFYQFQDKTQLLFSLGFSRQGFYRSNLIYSFGRTEDVPFGYLIKLTGGFEEGQYKFRPYAGISASAGFDIDHLGYLYSLCEFGSFIHDKSIQQGVFRLMFKYFTDLQTVNRFKFRQFITTEYTRGINRDEDEFVSLENRHGITGLGSRYLRGNEKKLLKLESVVFTPYQLFGFRFVGFAFADIGIIRGSAFDDSNNKLFSGIGIGLRIRNERLVFNTLQLKLTWYVSQPKEADYQYFIASGEPRLLLKNFYMEKPDIIHLR